MLMIVINVYNLPASPHRQDGTQGQFLSYISLAHSDSER